MSPAFRLHHALSRLRVRHGRRLAGADFRCAWSTARLLIGLLAVYALVGAIDRQTELEIALAREQQAAAQASRLLADCLNGTARWTTADGRALVACERAWSTPL